MPKGKFIGYRATPLTEAEKAMKPIVLDFTNPLHIICKPDVGGLLRLKARAPILAAKPQKPCDIGLFSDDADQLDLVEMFQDPAED